MSIWEPSTYGYESMGKMVSDREGVANRNLWNLMFLKEKAGDDAEILEGNGGEDD